jgi:hypothetical protein
MAKGPNPSGSSRASHKVPPLHRLPVKATPKVKASPNTVKDTNLQGKGPLHTPARGSQLSS